MISFDDIALKLIGWGYKVTKEPLEQRPPGMIELKYDMELTPEDVSCTSYEVTHRVDLAWVTDKPGELATTVTTLMGRLGNQYSSNAIHFEMKSLPLKRGNGTTYIATIVVSWMTFQNITT